MVGYVICSRCRQVCGVWVSLVCGAMFQVVLILVCVACNMDRTTQQCEVDKETLDI